MLIRRRNVSVKNVLIGREVNAYVEDNLIIDKSQIRTIDYLRRHVIHPGNK